MKKSVFINGIEWFRITKEEKGKVYLVGDSEGLTETNRSDFMTKFKRYEDLCMKSWNEDLREEYKAMLDYYNGVIIKQ